MNLALSKMLGGEDLQLALRMAGSTFTLQYTLVQSVTWESPELSRDLLGNEALAPLMRSFTALLGKVVESAGDPVRFGAMHAEIVEALGRNSSFAGADVHRQRAYGAIAGA